MLAELQGAAGEPADDTRCQEACSPIHHSRDRRGHGPLPRLQPPGLMERSQAEKRREQQAHQIAKDNAWQQISQAYGNTVRMGGASRTKNCHFSRFSYTQTQVRKKNKMKVIVAVGRKMLVAAWHVLKYNTAYRDFAPREQGSEDGKAD